MEACDHYFVPDAETIFKLVRVTSRAKDAYLVVDVEGSRKQPYQVKATDCIPAGSIQELEHPPDDLIKLQHVNRPGILHTLRSRFQHDLIYTSIGPILVALNPFKWIPGIYDEAVKEKYKRGEHNLSENPHVFAVAHDAFSDLSLMKDQSLIISGESGAGKTEATKQGLNYLAFIAGSSSGIQSKILQASPILEAWGNAKTLRNNNSSRFGKYIEVWFDDCNTIVGSSNTTYILEKSRVVFQSRDERNYHVFYQLLEGATSDTLRRYRLQPEGAGPLDRSQFYYINQSGCITIDDVNDAEDFDLMNKAFADVGFTGDEQDSLYRTVAGILQLGNINFVPYNDESVIEPSAEQWFMTCSENLGVDKDLFRQALLFKRIKSGGGKRASVAYSPYTPPAAVDNRDALAKEIYNRCFDWIVATINRLMFTRATQASLMIGILDIFGFEIFQKNSFEQLCINLANEALQQHFNYNIFQAEMNIYVAEDVPVPQLDFKDNQDVLDLIVKRPKGLIPMLDEEGMVPKGSWEGFFSKVSKQHATNSRVKIRNKTNELGIVHYAGEVYYDPSLFLIKNKDTLSQDLVEILAISEHRFLRELFDEDLIKAREEGALSFRSTSSSATLAASSASAKGPPKKSAAGDSGSSKQTVGRKFSLQMEALINNLNATKPRYIRCIKPNQVKKPNIFVHNLTNEQLTYSGVFEAVIIMQNGYPFRMTHMDFWGMYHGILSTTAFKQLICDGELHAHLLSQPDAGDLLANPVGLRAMVEAFQRSRPPPVSKRPPLTDILRDSCRLAVHLLSLDNPALDASKFYVGVSRTFYRANEHRLLRELRHERVETTCVRVQSHVRRYIATKLVGGILRLETQAMALILQRALQKLQTVSVTLQDLGERLRKACRTTCRIHIVDIAAAFTEALHTEGHCVSKMQEVTSSKSLSDEERYAALLPLMEQAKSINFFRRHKGKDLRLQWRENTVLVKNEEVVRVLGLKVRVQRQFKEGLRDKNELVLESAMSALLELRSSHVVDTQFCEAFENDAQAIIKSASAQYEDALTLLLAALPQGRCAVQRSQEAYEIQVFADPNPLKSVVATSRNPPLKVQLLLKTNESLMELRAAAARRDWGLVQDLVRRRWGFGEHPVDALESMAKVMSGEELFLPPSVREDVLTEVKELNIAAISSTLVPTFSNLLATNAVPAVPSYDTKGFIDTRELALELERTKQYEAYFDSNLLAFVDAMKEHLAIRAAVASGGKTQLVDTIASLRLLSKSHSDYVHALRFKRMYVAMDRVLASIAQEQWRGEAGHWDASQMQYEALRAALKAARDLQVGGDLWQQLLTIGGNMSELKSLLADKCLLEAEAHATQTMQSAVWRQLVTGDASFLPSDVRKALTVVEQDFSRLLAEVRHRQALDAVLTVFRAGAIPFDLEAPVPAKSDASCIKTCIASGAAVFIRSPSVERLLRDVEAIADLRQLLYVDDWTQLSQALLLLRDTTDGFRECHESCQGELAALMERLDDYNVQLALMEILPLREVPLANGNACQLRGAILQAADIKKLSINTTRLLGFAKGLYCLRCLLRDGLWEPIAVLFCGDVPSEHLAGVLTAVSKPSTPSKDPRMLESLVTTLRTLESTVQLGTIGVKVGRLDISQLSVLETLLWLQSSETTIPAACQQELSEIWDKSTDRRCRICLLLGAGIGRCAGSVDHLNHRLIKVDTLRSAIAFADEHEGVWGPATRAWVHVGRGLVQLREVILKVLTEQAMAGTHQDSLHEAIDVAHVEALLAGTQEGYGQEELHLIASRLHDLATFDELSKAAAFGGPSFENNKFDSTRLQFDHILERLENARRLKVRSDRLDRLFFYLELCINLRKAVMGNEWELSDGARKSLDRTIVTVKRCLTEYKQALKFFRTPAPGVPPQVLADEFNLVEREWDRKLILQNFQRAYQVGTVAGGPLQLHFHNVRLDSLEACLKRIKLLETDSGEVDKTVQVFANAAQELVEVRSQALLIHGTFRSNFKFSEQTDLQVRSSGSQESVMRVIAEDASFLADAVSKAVKTVERISEAPEANLSVYVPMERAVKKVKYALGLPYSLPEVELLHADLLEREFMVQVVKLLRKVPEMLATNMKFSLLLQDLTLILASFHNKQRSLLGDKRGAAKAVSRPSRVFDILYHSTIVLVHLYRAKVKENYDPMHRDWKVDVNQSRTPHLATIVKTLETGSYSIQQLIRAAYKLELHPVLIQALGQEAEIVEDRVSMLEMEAALSDPKYVVTGKVGSVVVPEESIAFGTQVLERLDGLRFSRPSAALVSLKRLLEEVMQLRRGIKEGNISACVAVIRQHLCLPLEGANVDAMLKTLFDSKDRKVAPIAEAEFKLLASEACDLYWQEQVRDALLSGAVKGVRGCIYAHQVDPRPIYRVTLLASALRVKSRCSLQLIDLCEEVMRMRVLVSGIQVTGVAPLRERSHSIRSLHAIEIGSFVDAAILSAVATVEQIAGFNWPMSFDEGLVDQIQDQTTKIQSLLDSEVLTKQLDPSIREFIVRESALLLEHYKFEASGHALDQTVDGQYIHFTAQGLTFSSTFNALELAVNQGVKEKFVPQRAHEYWNCGSFKIAAAMLALLKAGALAAASPRHESATLQPGTPGFDALLPPIYRLVKAYDDFGQHIATKVGHRKRTSFPPPILEASIRMVQAACLEHVHIRLLCRISKSECLVLYEDDENGKIFFHIKRIDNIPLLVHSQGTDSTEAYAQYSTGLLATLRGMPFFTIKGNRLKDFLIKLTTFRAYVHKKQWFNALQTSQSIDLIDGFNLYIKDIDYFKIHIGIIQAQRALEYYLFLCTLPVLPSWLLHQNAPGAIQAVGASLEAFMRGIVDGTTRPLPKYQVFEELSEVAYRMLDLLAAIKGGWFVHAVDLVDSNPLLAVARHVGDSLHLAFPSSGAGVAQESAYTCIYNLHTILLRAKCIEPYMRELLACELSKMEVELRILQLEQLALYTFRQLVMEGCPGELRFSPQALNLLTTLVDFFDLNHQFIHPYPLQQAFYSAKVMIKALQAQKAGDIYAAEQLFYIIAHMGMQEDNVLTMKTAGESGGTTYSMTELMTIEESDYQAFFERPLRVFTTEQMITFAPSADTVDRLESTALRVFRLLDPSTVDDVYSTTNAPLNKYLQEHLHMSLAQIHALPRFRKECAAWFDPLLKNHLLFELAYKLYLRCLTDKPASGSPGELICGQISVSIAEEVAELMRENGLVTDVEESESAPCQQLFHAVEAVRRIRRGQVEGDIALIEAGIALARQALEVEASREALPAPPSASVALHFGNMPKRFMSLNATEIDLAEADLQQRRIVLTLQQALAGGQIAFREGDAYPFDLSVVECDSLVAAVASCLTVIPTCQQAIDLHSAAELVLRVRRGIVGRDFAEVLKLLRDHLGDSDFLDDEPSERVVGRRSPLLEHNRDEMISAWRVAATTQAMERTLFAFAHGCIRGDMTRIEHPEEVNKDYPHEALKLFKHIKNAWKDDAILRFENTCEILLNVRTLFAERNFQTLYDLTFFLLTNADKDAIKMAAGCVEEITLAHRHAGYTLVVEALLRALSHGKLEGGFGDLSLPALSLASLEEAFDVADQIHVAHEDVDVLRHTCMLVYRVRRAQLHGRWIRIPVDMSSEALAEAHAHVQDLPAASRGESRFKTHKDVEFVEDILETFDAMMQRVHVLQGQKGRVRRDKAAETPSSAALDVPPGSLEAPASEPDTTSTTALAVTEESAAEELDSLQAPDEAAPRAEPPKEVLDENATLPSGVTTPSLQVPREVSSAEEEPSLLEQPPLSYSALAELRLAHDELLFRQILFKVVAAIYSLGYRGVPGLIVEDRIDTLPLEDAIEFSKFFPHIVDRSVCRALVKDAKLLLDGRRCRLASDFGQLNEIVSAAEDHNALVFQRRIHRHNDASKVVEKRKGGQAWEEEQPVTARVWEELKLLKYDALFNIVLCEFAQEMKKEEVLVPRRSSVILETALAEKVDFNDRIYRIEALLEFAKNAALQFASGEFDRLVEAMELGLRLRRFVRDEKHKSPQAIIDQVAKVKKRDQKRGATCYGALLIFEISKMSNVLDFPVLLEKIKYEIVHGQKYLDYPIGLIPYDKIDLRAMMAAYDAALPSLEIMGSDENHQFMKLAYAVMQLRRALKDSGDLVQAMNVVVTYEHLMRGNELVEEEVRRLRVEMENYDAGKLIAHGLKTGRYLDVIAIAKMRSKFMDEGAYTEEDDEPEGYTLETQSSVDADSRVDDSGRRMSLLQRRRRSTAVSSIAQFFPPPPEDSPKSAHQRRGSLTDGIAPRKRNSVVSAPANRRHSLVGAAAEAAPRHGSIAGPPGTRGSLCPPGTSRRVSQGIADMMAQFESLYLDSATDTSDVGLLAVPARHGASSQFVDVVRSSIYALKRAVAVTSRVSIKSDSTHYYLHAAKTVLELREAVVLNKWDVVQQIVSKEVDLPPVASQEVNAIREGLVYQQALEIVSKALMEGHIYRYEGSMDVAWERIEYAHLFDVLSAVQQGGFDDHSMLIIKELCKRVIALRVAFLRFSLDDAVISLTMSEEMQQEFAEALRGQARDEDDLIGEEGLDSCLEGFKRFEEVKLRALFMSLGLLATQQALQEGRKRASTDIYVPDDFALHGAHSVAAPARLDNNVYKLKPSPYYWISDLVEGIVSIKQEVEVIEKMRVYRDHMCLMIQCLSFLPRAVRVHLDRSAAAGNKGDGRYVHGHLVSLAEQFLCESQGDDVVPTGEAEAPPRLHHRLARDMFLHGDRFFLEHMAEVVDKVRAYMHVAEHTESMRALLATLEALFAYRQLLHSCSPAVAAERPGSWSLRPIQYVGQWLEETETRRDEHVFSTQYGVAEMNAYISIARRTLVVHAQVLRAVRTSRCLAIEPRSFNPAYHLAVDELEAAIAAAREECVDAGGPDLLVGVEFMLAAAERLVDARRLMCRAGAVDREVRAQLCASLEVLAQAAAEGSDSVVAEVCAELRFLDCCAQYHTRATALARDLLRGFPLVTRPEPRDVEAGPSLADRLADLLQAREDQVFNIKVVYGQTLGQSRAVVQTYCGLLHQGITGLQRLEREARVAAAGANSATADVAEPVGRERVSRCSVERDVPALLCWRDLLFALGHDHLVPRDGAMLPMDDPLVAEVFPLARHSPSGAAVLLGSLSGYEPAFAFPESADDLFVRPLPGPSVLEQLCVLRRAAASSEGHGAVFAEPELAAFLGYARDFVLERHLGADLRANVAHGSVRLHRRRGNLEVSELYVRLLALSLQTITSVISLAGRLGQTLRWSRGFVQTLRYGRYVLGLRQALVQPRGLAQPMQPSHVALARLLQAPMDGLLDQLGEAWPREVHEEPAVLRAFVRTARAADLLAHLLGHLVTLPKMTDETVRLLCPDRPVEESDQPAPASSIAGAGDRPDLVVVVGGESIHQVAALASEFVREACTRPVRSVYEEDILFALTALRNAFACARKGLGQLVLQEMRLLQELVEEWAQSDEEGAAQAWESDDLSASSGSQVEAASGRAGCSGGGVHGLIEAALPHVQHLLLHYCDRHGAPLRSIFSPGPAGSVDPAASAILSLRTPQRGGAAGLATVFSPAKALLYTPSLSATYVDSADAALYKAQYLQQQHEHMAACVVDTLIVTLCEILYFLPEDVSVFVLQREAFARRISFRETRDSVPVEIYAKLWVVLAELYAHADIVRLRPHWCASLLLVAAMLRESLRAHEQEAVAAGATAAAQTVCVPRALLAFLQDLRLAQYIAAPPHAHRAIYRDGFYPLDSPSLLTLAAHLRALKIAEDRAGPCATWGTAAGREPPAEAFLRADDLSTPAATWLAHHLRHMALLCRDSSAAPLDDQVVGLAGRSEAIYGTLLKALN